MLQTDSQTTDDRRTADSINRTLKWFKCEDEMTNLGEYDFTQSTSLNLYRLN